MKLRDKGEFEFLGFNSESGLMTTSFLYNNEVAEVPDVAEQDPIRWAWMSSEEDLKICDRR